jgi:membrane protein DedA with SNARE-associated domain
VYVPVSKGHAIGQGVRVITVQDTVLHFIQEQHAWAPPIVFLLAFGESLAFVSLLLPATIILLALGGVLGAAGLSFWPVWIAAATGAIVGDWLSYWLGYHYQYAIAQVWPLSRHPQFLVRGERIFRRWGVVGVFCGRFFGPLRAAVPLVAGIFRMPNLQFQLANIASGVVWATGILAPGMFGGRWLV